MREVLLSLPPVIRSSAFQDTVLVQFYIELQYIGFYIKLCNVSYLIKDEFLFCVYIFQFNFESQAQFIFE